MEYDGLVDALAEEIDTCSHIFYFWIAAGMSGKLNYVSLLERGPDLVVMLHILFKKLFTSLE